MRIRLGRCGVDVLVRTTREVRIEGHAEQASGSQLVSTDRVRNGSGRIVPFL